MVLVLKYTVSLIFILVKNTLKEVLLSTISKFIGLQNDNLIKGGKFEDSGAVEHARKQNVVCRDGADYGYNVIATDGTSVKNRWS